jgi:hypothetical protein
MDIEIVRRVVVNRSNPDESVTPQHVRTLVDDDCWEHLIELSQVLGLEETIDRFVTAMDGERERLDRLRRWLGEALRMATEEQRVGR